MPQGAAGMPQHQRKAAQSANAGCLEGLAKRISKKELAKKD